MVLWQTPKHRTHAQRMFLQNKITGPLTKDRNSVIRINNELLFINLASVTG